MAKAGFLFAGYQDIPDVSSVVEAFRTERQDSIPG
jgi:hypothetical protein